MSCVVTPFSVNSGVRHGRDERHGQDRSKDVIRRLRRGVNRRHLRQELRHDEGFVVEHAAEVEDQALNGDVPQVSRRVLPAVEIQGPFGGVDEGSVGRFDGGGFDGGKVERATQPLAVALKHHFARNRTLSATMTKIGRFAEKFDFRVIIRFFGYYVARFGHHRD